MFEQAVDYTAKPKRWFDYAWCIFLLMVGLRLLIERNHLVSEREVFAVDSEGQAVG